MQDRLRRAREAFAHSKLSHALAALLAALVAIGVTINVTDNGPGHRTVTISVGGGRVQVPTESKVDTSAKPGIQPTTVKAPASAVKQAAKSPELTQPGGLRTEAPPGVTQAQLDASQDKQEQLAQSDQLPIVQPDAAPEQRGCVSRFVRNYSSRRGVAPRIWTLHYTVSHNILGWGDVDAIVNLFNSTSSQASSNYVIDTEGHCAYIVRESDKAWTQAGGNPYSISVEVVDYGNEPVYLQSAGLTKLAEVISDSAKRWDIPIQRGAVNGCVPTRPGIVQHKDWGACGGGHFDITPFSVDQVIQAVQAYRSAQACPARCQRAKALRAKHARTHARFRKNHCARRGPHGQARHGYCDTLRARNAAVHRAAKAEHISLAGTYGR